MSSSPGQILDFKLFPKLQYDCIIYLQPESPTSTCNILSHFSNVLKSLLKFNFVLANPSISTSGHLKLTLVFSMSLLLMGLKFQSEALRNDNSCRPKHFWILYPNLYVICFLSLAHQTLLCPYYVCSM